MASENAKKTGLVVALGLPPPGKLKKPMSDDSGEESEDEGEDMGGGAMALGEMWDALKSGDKAAAFDAFCDAMSIAKGKAHEAESKGEAYGAEE